MEKCKVNLSVICTVDPCTDTGHGSSTIKEVLSIIYTKYQAEIDNLLEERGIGGVTFFSTCQYTSDSELKKTT